VDRIRICDMKVFGHTGCLPEEKENGQFFIISCEMVIDDIKGKVTDDLEDTVDYSRIYKVIEERVSGSYYDLIEHLAYVIAGDVLEQDGSISEVTITVSKPDAPINGDFRTVETEITRRRN